MNLKNPRKLDYNAPFLSTRRPSCLELCRANSQGALRETRNRVPFSWEQSPGKPKETAVCNTLDIPVPPPKPPPGRQFPPKDLLRNENDYDADKDNNNDDNFSDAMDTFSLSAAIDMVESEERERHIMFGGVSIEGGGSQSPSFIIQRFLSDAKALAISSGLPISTNIIHNRGISDDSSHHPEKCMAQKGMKSSPKGCGLQVFFPWRTMKHKPCSVKSPVRFTSMSEKVKPKWGTREKHKSALAEGSSTSGV